MPPSSIRCFNSIMLSPVVLLICCNGLKPALTICSRSCPIRRPAADICENAKDIILKRSLFPPVTSDSIRRFASTSCAATLKLIIVFAACAAPLNVTGDSAANLRICSKIIAPSFALPVRTSNAIVASSTCDARLIAFETVCTVRYAAANPLIDDIALLDELDVSRIALVVCSTDRRYVS